MIPAGHNRGDDATTTPEHALLPNTHAPPSFITTTVGQYDPAGHATGAYALSPANEQLAPSGHATGADKPAAGHMLPDRHTKHATAALLWPVALPNVPLGHGVGLTAPSGQIDPTGHTKADDRPDDGQYWPSGHTLGRASAGAGHTKPGGQGAGCAEPEEIQNKK